MKLFCVKSLSCRSIIVLNTKFSPMSLQSYEAIITTFLYRKVWPQRPHSSYYSLPPVYQNTIESHPLISGTENNLMNFSQAPTFEGEFITERPHSSQLSCMHFYVMYSQPQYYCLVTVILRTQSFSYKSSILMYRAQELFL